MVHVRKNDFGGLSRGIENFGNSIAQALSKRAENKQWDRLFAPAQQTQNNPPDQQTKNFLDDEAFVSNFLETVKNYENETGESVGPDQFSLFLKNAVSAAEQSSQAPGEPQKAEQPYQAPGEPQKYNQRQLAEISRKNPQAAAVIQREQIASEGHQIAREGLAQKESLAREGLAQKESLARDQMAQKESLAKKERDFKTNAPYRERMGKQRKTVAQKQIALVRVKDALASGDIKNLQNFLADRSDNEYLRTAGLNNLNSAVKEFFLADMQGMPTGVRLNKFLQKNLFQALESGGKDSGSNQKIVEYQHLTVDIDEKEIEIYNKLVEKYEQQGLEPPASIERQVEKQLIPYATERMKEMSQVYKDINDGKIMSSGAQAMKEARKRVGNIPAPYGHVWILTPKGDIRKCPNSKIKDAKAAGAEIVIPRGKRK